MLKTNHPHGTSYENERAFVFFGNKHFSSSDTVLNKNLLIFGKQTHDERMSSIDHLSLQASSSLISSSDGLQTKKTNTKLSVITADCIPCFVFDKENLYSLHLGWRGVQKGLFDSTLLKCSGDITIVTGPHIQKESFEVKSDVVEALQKTMSRHPESWFQQKNTTKYNVSLIEILKLKSNHLKPTLICSNVDTFTSKDHISYRKTQQNGIKTSQRNISFAFTKSKVK